MKNIMDEFKSGKTNKVTYSFSVEVIDKINKLIEEQKSQGKELKKSNVTERIIEEYLDNYFEGKLESTSNQFNLSQTISKLNNVVDSQSDIIKKNINTYTTDLTLKNEMIKKLESEVQNLKSNESDLMELIEELSENQKEVTGSFNH